MITTAALDDFSIDWRQRIYADLTLIKGIGPARQQWLREAFNVRAFQDLAALTLDEIQAKLRASGQIASRQHIDQWIAQAKQLMITRAEPSVWLAVEAKNNAAIHPPPGNATWKPFASFVVEFQTRPLAGQGAQLRTKVHHIEEDTCAHWPGIENQQLVQWMLAQVMESMTHLPPASKLS